MDYKIVTNTLQYITIQTKNIVMGIVHVEKYLQYMINMLQCHYNFTNNIYTNTRVLYCNLYCNKYITINYNSDTKCCNPYCNVTIVTIVTIQVTILVTIRIDIVMCCNYCNVL